MSLSNISIHVKTEWTHVGRVTRPVCEQRWVRMWAPARCSESRGPAHGGRKPSAFVVSGANMGGGRDALPIMFSGLTSFLKL